MTDKGRRRNSRRMRCKSVHQRHETLVEENIIMGGERDGGMEEWRGQGGLDSGGCC